MTQREAWKQALQHHDRTHRQVEAADTVLSALDLLLTEYGDSKEHQPEAAFMAEVVTLALDLAIKRYQR